MSIRTLKALFGIAAKTTSDRKVSGSGRRWPARLSVERLEARDVPSVFNVTTEFDSGPGSLREAIAAANAHPNDESGSDVVQIADNVQIIQLESPLPDITDGVQIIGRSSGTRVMRDPEAPENFRIITIDPNDGSSRLENLEITGGGVDGDGGGISSTGQLIIVNCWIHANTATHDGGGIHQQMAPLTIVGGTVGDNIAGNNGGGICFVGTGALALTINDAQLSYNLAYTNGGGIFYDAAQGALRVTNSNFDTNYAVLNTPDLDIGGRGGGIYCVCTDIDIVGGSMTRNLAVTFGGAIYAEVLGEGTFDSLIVGNRTSQQGGPSSGPNTSGMYVRRAPGVSIFVGPYVIDPYYISPL